MRFRQVDSALVYSMHVGTPPYAIPGDPQSTDTDVAGPQSTIATFPMHVPAAHTGKGACSFVPSNATRRPALSTKMVLPSRGIGKIA